MPQVDFLVLHALNYVPFLDVVLLGAGAPFYYRSPRVDVRGIIVDLENGGFRSQDVEELVYVARVFSLLGGLAGPCGLGLVRAGGNTMSFAGHCCGHGLIPETAHVSALRLAVVRVIGVARI